MPPHVSEAQQAINDEVLTIVMIESPEAVKNADDIASVDGVDVLLIGSFDLTSELGIPGQMGHQKLIDAYQAVGDACRKHGKVLGMGGINGDEDARRYIGMGARYLSSGNDHSFIVSGSIERAKFFRDIAASATGNVKDGKKKKKG
jgi:2-keto-3-deoxy-L-rhamnonate aldolase RhmA